MSFEFTFIYKLYTFLITVIRMFILLFNFIVSMFIALYDHPYTYGNNTSLNISDSFGTNLFIVCGIVHPIFKRFLFRYKVKIVYKIVIE